jgi:hypothetical protein
MEKARVLIGGVLAGTLTCLVAMSLLLPAADCAAGDVASPWDRHYDPRRGSGRADIRNHFNLHRGRWWDYYYRGSLYLAYGHYEDALNDFTTAAAKRSRDGRDARTYGMHFIDYFPHRESGVAYYFQGQLATNDERREECYRSAIAELETSVRQEESARAKSYLTRARRALWQTAKDKDTVAPTVQVKKPIYANRRRIRFVITVTDEDSFVGDIRVDRSVGNVRIDRTSLFIGVPRRQVTRTADLTLGPGAKMAVVVITASDLAGNRSEPNRALIILDTEAPTADLSVVRDAPMAGGLVKIAIDAQDDFGLKEIQVGQDSAGKVECDGALRYSGVVAGTPRDGELRIAMVDNAGNRTAASIPLEPNGGQDLSAAASSSPVPSWTPLMDPPGRLSWSPALWPAHLRGSGGVLRQPPISLYHAAGAYVSPRTVAASPRWGPPEFRFDRDVKGPDGMPRETSERTFTVAGTLWRPRQTNRVKVELNDQQREDVWERAQDQDRQCHILRPLSVDLSNVPIGETQTVTVEAYRKDRPDAPWIPPEILKVKRVKDASRDGDAIYGLLVLPPLPSRQNDLTAPDRSSDWGPSKLGGIYKDVLKELRSLSMSSRSSNDEESLNAFNVYDVNAVYRIADSSEWYRDPKTEVEVSDDLRRWRTGERRRGSRDIRPTVIDPNLIDLVVFGDVAVYSSRHSSVRDEEVAIGLRAVDVATSGGPLLRFPQQDVGPGVPLLTDTIYGTENKQDQLEMLAATAANNVPRLRAEVVVEGAGGRVNNRTLTFGLGQRDGVFVHMKLWLYEKDGLRNTKLTKIACLDLKRFDSESSQIYCDTDLSSRLKPDLCDYVVITK